MKLKQLRKKIDKRINGLYKELDIDKRTASMYKAKQSKIARPRSKTQLLSCAKPKSQKTKVKAKSKRRKHKEMDVADAIKEFGKLQRLSVVNKELWCSECKSSIVA